MNSVTCSGLVSGWRGCLALYFLYHHLQYFGDITFLGGILLLELIIACLWKYDQRFIVLVVIAFVGLA